MILIHNADSSDWMSCVWSRRIIAGYGTSVLCSCNKCERSAGKIHNRFLCLVLWSVLVLSLVEQESVGICIRVSREYFNRVSVYEIWNQIHIWRNCMFSWGFRVTKITYSSLKLKPWKKLFKKKYWNKI